MPRPPKFWEDSMRTPDEHKVVLSGEPFVDGRHRTSKRWRKGRKRKTVVSVSEPLAKMIDDVMAKEGVSDVRLERALGLYEGKLACMRKDEGQWRFMKTVRQMLWAMGYDLEMRVVRVAKPDKVLVLTNSEIDLKKAERVRAAGKWQKDKMWSWLKMDKL